MYGKTVFDYARSFVEGFDEDDEDNFWLKVDYLKGLETYTGKNLGTQQMIEKRENEKRQKEEEVLATSSEDVFAW